MKTIFIKEIRAYLGSLLGYLTAGLFLLVMGLFLWVFSETSVWAYNFATLESFFAIAPLLFVFIIPALTMRSFAEEKEKGTLEWLHSKPVPLLEIIFGKFLATASLILGILIATLSYVYTIYILGNPVGNIDMGSIIGSYLGLYFCSLSFVAIGLLASAWSGTQILAFLSGTFLCFFFFLGLDYLSNIPVVFGNLDSMLQKMSLYFHYESLSKGLIEIRSIVFFIVFISVFIVATHYLLIRNKDQL